ncbi:hypothetical protein PENTCL1PPCAC_9405, partial [Pristionchus entomophagus]
LRRGSIDRKDVLMMLLCFVTPHVTANAIFFATAQIPDEEARRLIEEHVPQYANKKTIIASDHLLSPAIACTLFYVCVVIYPALVVFWKLRSKTVSELDAKSHQMSVATRAQHQ